MPTLYVRNVPDELYEALRARARVARTSISTEVLGLLEQNVPAASELARRRELLKRVVKLRSRRSPRSGPFISSEEQQRRDRLR